MSLFVQVVGLAVLAALLTGLAVGLANLRASREALESEVRAGLERDARVIRQTLTERIEVACQLVDTLAAEDLLTHTPNILQSAIDRRIASADLLASVFVFDNENTVTAAGYHDGRDTAKYLGQDLKATPTEPSEVVVRETILGARARRKPTFSRGFLDSKGSPMFIYAVPTRAGTVSGGIKGEDPRVRRFMESLRPPREGFVGLSDSELGVLAMAGNPPEGLAGATFPEGEVVNHAGYLVVATVEPRTRLNVVMGVPEKALQSALGELSRDLLVSTLLAVLLAGFLAAGYARRLGAPLQALVSGLRDIREGIYAHRIDSEVSGDLGDAVEAFNEMADKLERTRVIEEVWTETWDE